MLNIVLITAMILYCFVYDVLLNLTFLVSVPLARAISNSLFYLYAEIIFAAAKRVAGIRTRLIRFSKSAVLPDRFIVVSNHQTLIDILAIILLFPTHHIRFIAKESLSKYTPCVRSFLISQRHAAINRSMASRNDIMEFKKRLLRMTAPHHQPKKTCFIIFPEGTRSKAETMLPFKRFGFKLLTDCLPGTPIASVAIHGGSNMGKVKNLLALKASKTEKQYTAKAVKLHTDVPTNKHDLDALFTHIEEEIRDAKTNLNRGLVKK